MANKDKTLSFGRILILEHFKTFGCCPDGITLNGFAILMKSPVAVNADFCPPGWPGIKAAADKSGVCGNFCRHYCRDRAIAEKNCRIAIRIINRPCRRFRADEQDVRWQCLRLHTQKKIDLHAKSRTG